MVSSPDGDRPSLPGRQWGGRTEEVLMSVLHRSPASTDADVKGALPRQRSAGPRTPMTAPPSVDPRKYTTAMIAAGLIALGAAGTAVWVTVEDDGSPVAPASTTVDRSPEEMSLLEERLRSEQLRDAARAANNAAG